MKHILSLLLCLALAAGLAACGETADHESSAAAQSSSAESGEPSSEADEPSSGVSDVSDEISEPDAPSSVDIPEEKYDMSLFGREYTLGGISGESKSIIIKSGTLDKIEGSMFGGNTELEYVYIEDGVTAISKGAFAGCTALKAIRLPDTLTSLGESAFSGCTALESIYLPDSLADIETEAFAMCTSLAVVKPPKALRNIGFGAFSGCTALKNVTLPDTLRSTGRSAFMNTGVGYLVLPDGLSYFWAVGIDTVYIKKGTLTYDTVTFDDCGMTLKDISEAPEDVSVPEEAYDMTLFTDQYPAAPMSIPYAEGITVKAGEASAIGSDLVWENRASIKYIYIEDGVTEIGDTAFAGFASLETIRLPSTLKSLGAYAFDGCASLKRIYLPASLKAVGAGAFIGCSSLLSVSIPEGIEVINECAFAACRSLAGIVLPSTLTSLGPRAFSGSGISALRLPDGLTECGSPLGVDYVFVKKDSTAYKTVTAAVTGAVIRAE